MRQIWITKAGGPEVLEVREAPTPEPGAGEIRIRVKASGVNFADIMARMGQYPDAPPIPCVVGYEVSGDVDAVGPGVTGFSQGDRVVSLTQFNGYSDAVVVPAVYARRLPDQVTYEAAAAIPVNYCTAWIMLVRCGNIQAGETALVHSAGGGVGLAALQICQWRGAHVVGTASAGKHARLTEMGVAHCIDYNTEDFEQEVMGYTQGQGVDIVLDAVGGRSFKKGYRCLAPLGRLFMFGVSSSAVGKRRSIAAIAKTLLTMPWFHPIPLIDKNRGVFGTNMGHLWDVMDKLGADMDHILQLTAEGAFAPVVDATFPFDQAGEAHAYIQDRKNFGKVLLTP
ncbi:MAG: synaptic vesicle VAT-1 family membrane protein [Candidatus Hydrogenedentota bacterium]